MASEACRCVAFPAWTCGALQVLWACAVSRADADDLAGTVRGLTGGSKTLQTENVVVRRRA
jgi:hypothetical protein